jgi:hypothetical protein
MTKTRVIGSLAAVFAVAWMVFWVFFSGDVFATHASNKVNRIALIRVTANLSVGNDYEQVLRTFWQESTQSDLRLDVRSKEIWRATMPGEFGAGDWVLHIRFEAGQVAELKILSSDGQPVTLAEYSCDRDDALLGVSASRRLKSHGNPTGTHRAIASRVPLDETIHANRPCSAAPRSITLQGPR